MTELLPIDPRGLAERNFLKYIDPPSFELIEEVIRKSKLKTGTRFERYHNIAKDSIRSYKKGKPFARKYWHIFYEYDTLRKEYSNPKLGVVNGVNSKISRQKKNNLDNDYKQRYAV